MGGKNGNKCASRRAAHPEQPWRKGTIVPTFLLTFLGRVRRSAERRLPGDSRLCYMRKDMMRKD